MNLNVKKAASQVLGTVCMILIALLLGVAVVNSEIAYILKFQDFIPHTITREQNTTSEIRILDFIWNTDRIRLSTQAIGYIQQSNKLEFKKETCHLGLSPASGKIAVFECSVSAIS